MGWNPVAFSEIEKFPSEVLAHHYPNVPNLGDMTKFNEWNINETINLLVGGTPCQSFSVAGLRKGLGDPRGNIMLTYLAIANKYRPKWVVWENVPGVLSSNGGNDFAALLRGLAECGYGFAYRILDSQYFGVPQRRRRVFVVGCLGSWQSAAAVLFEQESLRGNPAPSRKSGQEVAATITTRTGNSYNNHEDCVIQKTGFVEGSFANYKENDIAATLKASGGALGGGSETFLTECVAHAFKMRGGCEGGGKGYLGKDDVAFTLSTQQDQQIFYKTAVRRLMPIECERLQGFPDNYTKIKENGGDAPRYKAIGNSMAVPVMKWIGERIQMVNNEI